MKPIINFSLDIETLGTKPGSIVTEVGIVNDYNADELHQFFNPDIQRELGLKIDEETVQWHRKNNPNFESMVGKCHAQVSGIAPFVDQLRKVTDYFAQFDPDEYDCRVWMNSPSFDAVLLKVLYDGVSLLMPWNFRDERDLRTLRDLAETHNKHKDGVLPAKPDNAHDALVDAKYQLEIVTICLADLA